MFIPNSLLELKDFDLRKIIVLRNPLGGPGEQTVEKQNPTHSNRDFRRGGGLAKIWVQPPYSAKNRAACPRRVQDVCTEAARNYSNSAIQIPCPAGKHLRIRKNTLPSPRHSTAGHKIWWCEGYRSSRFQSLRISPLPPAFPCARPVPVRRTGYGTHREQYGSVKGRLHLDADMMKAIDKVTRDILYPMG